MSVLPSNSICPSKHEICIVFTDDPLAPDNTINCRLFLGNFSIRPFGRQALLIMLLAGPSLSLYARSMSMRRLGIVRLSRWYCSRRSRSSSWVKSSFIFMLTPLAAHALPAKKLKARVRLVKMTE